MSLSGRIRVTMLSASFVALPADSAGVSPVSVASPDTAPVSGWNTAAGQAAGYTRWDSTFLTAMYREVQVELGCSGVTPEGLYLSARSAGLLSPVPQRGGVIGAARFTNGVLDEANPSSLSWVGLFCRWNSEGVVVVIRGNRVDGANRAVKIELIDTEVPVPDDTGLEFFYISPRGLRL